MLNKQPAETYKEDDELITQFLEHCHIKGYPAKSVIIKAGESSTELFYVVRGSVTVQVEDKKGRGIVLAYLNEGEFFGELGLFDAEQKRTAFVRAKTTCNIAKISYERVMSLDTIFPRLLFSIASQLAIRLRNTSSKVRDLAFTDVQGRIARTLLDLCKEPDAMTHPEGMQIKITRQELGRIVGCSREMVGRVLKSLVAQLVRARHS